MTFTKKLYLSFGASVTLTLISSLVSLAVVSSVDCIPGKGATVAFLSFARWTAPLFVVLSLLLGISVAFIRQVTRVLNESTAELAQGAEQVAHAAAQIATTSQSLADGASQQARSLQDTSASAEEISSMARRNSENSRSAANVVKQSEQRVDVTNESLKEMVSAMAEINTSSGKIARIIKVIDEIAFQTNILALNAAVEAARAGEAGMGFAVVADEVRNLAQRCAQAARDTAALIEESIAKSNGGKTKFDQVAGAIHSITEDSTTIRTLVDEVSLGSEEQVRGIEQIGRAIIHMEQLTQRVTANAEESASAADQLYAQSEALKAVVERLTTTVNGSERKRSNPPSGLKTTSHSRISRRDLNAMVPSQTPRPSTGPQPSIASLAADKNSFSRAGEFIEF